MSTETDTKPVGALSALLAAAPPSFRIEDDDGIHDAGTLKKWSESAKRAVCRAGVVPGDRVLVLIGRAARDVALILGVQDSGAIVVPVDSSAPKRRRDSIIADCAARFIVATDSVGEFIVSETRTAIAQRIDADEISGSLMIYTSGSSGTPKGIVCPGDAITFAVNAIERCLGYEPTDRVAQPLPLTFDYGLYQVWLAMSAGAHVKLYAEGAVGPSFFRRLDQDWITVLPTMPVLSDSLIRIFERRGGNLRSLRLITSTGGDCPERQVVDLRRLAPHARVVPMYGLTECKRATISPVRDTGSTLGSGQALPGTQVRIRSSDRTDLPANTTGEIHVGGPHVMAGYWPLSDSELNQPFYTDPTGTRWVATGDSGQLDQNHVLFVEGRLDDVFKSNGFRTSVAEVEDALKSINGVDQACVVPPRGDSPYAAYYVGSARNDVVRIQLHEELESPKHPPTLTELEEMPVNANGKIDRTAVARIATSKEVCS